MTELADLTATELLALYAQKEASPTEAVRSCLSQMDRLEPTINAVLTVRDDECLAEAAESEKRWMSGTPRVLDGVPYGAKDIISTAGIRTTGGSIIYKDHVPSENAAVIDRLESEGALLLAKLQTFEFAMGDNSHYGPTGNPWNLSRTSGGSSSGSAAAVAARELPLALGTDTGGSIRVPATFCGITGFKPTMGLVPRHGIMPQSWTLDHVGPMARSVEDIAHALTVIAGHDSRDPTSLHQGKSDYVDGLDDGVRGLRLGLPRNWFFDLIDPAVDAAVRGAVDALADDGADIVEVEIPACAYSDAVGWTIMYAEYAALHEVTFDRIDEYSTPLSQQLLASSQFISALDYLRALRVLHVIQLDFERAFAEVDALIVPGMAGVAPKNDDLLFSVGEKTFSWGDLVARMTMVFNLTGIPALSLPAGLSDCGLPLGIQIAAPPLSDAVCLRVGHAYQRITSHHSATPAFTEEKARNPG